MEMDPRQATEDGLVRQAQHASLRAEVSTALTERAPLATILQRCAEAMVRSLQAAFARIWTLKPGEDALLLQASAGKYTHLNGAHGRIPVGELEIGWIAQERQPHLTNDVQHDPRISDREWARREGMVSFAGYPLVVEEQVVGVMGMFAYQPLLEDTLDALASVAQAIAQGIGRKWAEEQLEERVRERTRELGLLLEVSEHIASTLELQPLLDTILARLKTVVDYRAAVIYAWQDDRLTMLDYQGEQAFEEFRKTLAGFERDMTRMLQDRRRDPLVIDDTSRRPQDAQAPHEAAGMSPGHIPLPVGSWMGVPLLVKEKTIGLLMLAHSQPRYYSQQRADLVRALANLAAVVLEHARLYEQAQELAALRERQRLARELHDSVSQALYSIALHARRALVERDPGKLAGTLDQLLAQARAAQAEMRALIFELRPESLSKEGIASALKKQAEAIQARSGLPVVTDLGAEPALPLAAKEALYRIAQEALHNSVKHARAATAQVRLRVLAAGVQLEISDNGVGFDPERSFPGHLGLQSMRERVSQLGGSLEIASAPGQGTRIRVTIPQWP